MKKSCPTNMLLIKTIILNNYLKRFLQIQKTRLIDLETQRVSSKRPVDVKKFYWQSTVSMSRLKTIKTINRSKFISLTRERPRLKKLRMKKQN